MAARGAKQIDARAVKVLGKLSSENLEKVLDIPKQGPDLRRLSLDLSFFSPLFQLVHGVIDGVCEKQGPRYETFAKTLSLADFSRLVRCVEAAVKAVGREGGSKQQVGPCRCVISFQVCCIRMWEQVVL